MNWKKDKYLITVYLDDGVSKGRKFVNGIYIEEDGWKIGIHKADAGVWIVTDISTGCMLHLDGTQKACKEWVAENIYVILDILDGPKHEQLVKELEDATEGNQQ